MGKSEVEGGIAKQTHRDRGGGTGPTPKRWSAIMYQPHCRCRSLPFPIILFLGFRTHAALQLTKSAVQRLSQLPESFGQMPGR